MTKIIERENIKLDEKKLRMIRSGWGEKSIDNTVVEKITYLSEDLKVKGYIAYPTDESRKYPCIIWCRGGLGNKGAVDEFTARGVFGQMASWGYVVLATQYRGNVGGEGQDEFGGRDLNDVINLIPLAEEIPNANTEVWGIEGWSRGGMMTYLTLTRSDIFKAAVVTGAISDLNCNYGESKFMRRLYEEVFGKEKKLELDCSERSVINFADKITNSTNLLIVHGTNDERVSPMDSIKLSKKLIEIGKHHRLIMLENGDHFLKKHREELDIIRKNWFDKYLK